MMTVKWTRDRLNVWVYMYGALVPTLRLFPRTPLSSRSRAEDENYTPINALSYLPSPHAP